MLDNADADRNLILFGLDTVRGNMMTLYNCGSYQQNHIKVTQVRERQVHILCRKVVNKSPLQFRESVILKIFSGGCIYTYAITRSV